MHCFRAKSWCSSNFPSKLPIRAFLIEPFVQFCIPPKITNDYKVNCLTVNMALDIQGTVVSVIQVIALIFLLIGVYPNKIRIKNRNLIMHGFFSVVAIILNLATVISVMIPVFVGSLASISNLSFVQSVFFWSHAVLGIVAIVLGLIIIFSWVVHPLGELGCSKMWRLMIPTFVIWAFVLFLGLVIHIFNII